MGPVHRTVNPVYGFSEEKINPKLKENPRAVYFCRKAHVVYFIYELVPAILHKQTQTFLKLYFCPCNFVFRSLYNI
jgi:hypothetical protein